MSLYGTETFESQETLVQRYQRDYPQYANWGPKTLYSTLAQYDPTLVQRVSGGEPAFKTKADLIASIRSGNPNVASLSDDDLWANELRQRPDLSIWDQKVAAPKAAKEPEAEEDPFFVANPQWIGPKPRAELSTLRNYGRYAEIQLRNAKGQAGFGEQLLGNARAAIPYLDTILDIGDIGRVGLTALKLKNGEAVDDNDLLDFNLYWALQDRAANASWLGHAGGGLMASIGFVGEVAGALSGVGLIVSFFSQAGKAGAKKSALVLGREIIERMANKGTAKMLKKLGVNVADDVAEKGAKEMLEKSGASLAKRMTARTVGAAAGAIPAGATYTLVKSGVVAAGTAAMGGDAVTSKAAAEAQLTDRMQGIDKPIEAYVWKAALSDAIDSATEFTGAATFGLLVDDLAGPVLRALASNTGIQAITHVLTKARPGVSKDLIKKQVQDIVKKNTALTAIAAWTVKHGWTFDEAIAKLKNVGKDSVLEEMLEERVAGFWHGVFGTDNDPNAGAIDGLLVSPDQFKAELLQFSLPFATLGAIHFAQRKALGVALGKDFYAERQKAAALIDDIRTQYEEVKDPVTGKVTLKEKQKQRAFDENDLGWTKENKGAGGKATSLGEASDALFDLTEAWDSGVKNSFTAKVVKTIFDVATLPLTWDPGVLSTTSMEQSLGERWNIFATARGIKAVLKSQNDQAPADKKLDDAALRAKAKEVFMDAYKAWGPRVVYYNSSLSEAARNELLALDKAGRLTTDDKGRVFVRLAQNGANLSPVLQAYLKSQNALPEISAADTSYNPELADAEDIYESLDFGTVDGMAKAMSFAYRWGVSDLASAANSGDAAGFLDALKRKVAVARRGIAQSSDPASLHKGSLLSKADDRLRIVSVQADSFTVEPVDHSGNATGQTYSLAKADINTKNSADGAKWSAVPTRVATGAWGFIVGTEADIRNNPYFKSGNYKFHVTGRGVLREYGKTESGETLYAFRPNATKTIENGVPVIRVSPWAPPSAVAEDFVEAGVDLAEEQGSLLTALNVLFDAVRKSGQDAADMVASVQAIAGDQELAYKLASLHFGGYLDNLAAYRAQLDNKELPVASVELLMLRKLAQSAAPAAWDNYTKATRGVLDNALGAGWQQVIANPYADMQTDLKLPDLAKKPVVNAPPPASAPAPASAPTSAPASSPASAPASAPASELQTPEEFKAGQEVQIPRSGIRDAGELVLRPTQRNAIKDAYAERRPVNAAAADEAARGEHPLAIPEGYARQGDQYVYQQPAAPPPAAPPPAAPPPAAPPPAAPPPAAPPPAAPPPAAPPPAGRPVSELDRKFAEAMADTTVPEDVRSRMEAVAPKPRPILSQEDAQRLDQERAAFVEIYQNYLAKKEDAIPGSRQSASLESAAAGAQRSPWQAKVPKPIRSAVPPETMMGLVQGTLDLLHATDTRSAEEIAAVDQAIKALTVKGAPDAAFFSSLPQRIQQLSAAMDTLAIRYAANNPFEFGEDRSRIALTLSFAKELHAAKQSILAAFDAVKLDPAKRAAAYGAANLGSLGPLLDAASAEGAEVATAALVDALEAERRDLDESFPQMSAVERQKLLERTSPVLRVFFWNLARFVPKEQDHSALILRAIASHPNWFGGANRDGESVFSSPEELRRFLGMPGTEGEKRAFATPRNSDFAGKALWMAMRHMPVSAAREVGRYLRSIVAPKVDISTGLATASGATAARLHARRAADGSIQVTGEIGVDRSADLAGSRFIKRVSDSILNTVFSGSSTDREELDAALSTAAATFDGNQRQGYASTFRKLMAVLSPENTGLWALASDSLKDADYGAMGPQADQRIRDFVAAIRLALRTAPSPGRANEIDKRVRAAVSGLYNSVFSSAIVPNDEWQQTPLVDSQNHKPSYRLRSFLDTVFSPNEITRLSGITIDLERLRSDFSPEVVQSFTFDDADSDAVVRTMLQEALARRFLADEGKTRLGVVIPGGGKSDISVVWLEPSAVLRDSGAAKLGGDWETVATQGLTAALVRMGFPEVKGLDVANAESLAAIEGIIRKRGEKFSSPGLAFDPWATYLHDAHDGTFPITRVGKLKTFVIIGRADMRGADGQTLPLELLKGAALPTRNGRAALEAAGYGQVSWDIKAHMWGRRGDSTVHMKPVFAHPDSVPEAADLLDAADRAGYRVVADTDCTKLPNYKRIPAAERVRLSVGDVVYEGFELEIEPQNLLEVAFLDASSVTRPRTLPATLSYDRITAGSDRETTPNAFFRIIERAVKRVKGLKDSMLGRRITPHQESQRAHIIGRENISYPPVARTLRDLHNAVLREQTDVSGVGTFAVQVPSGGIVLKDPVFNSAGVQTHAAGDVFWPFGEDTALRYYEKRNGRLISQGVRLNIRGNGVRRSRRLVFSDSTSRKAFLDELQSKPFAEGVALLRARGDFSEAVSLNDLWRGRDNDLDIEDGFRLEGDTTLVVRGTAVMLYRTPGGHPIYPYARARIEDWVSPDPKDPEQAGRTAEVKFHPQHVANGGSDMDGDQVTVHIEANAWDGAQWVTPDIRDETEGEFAMSNQLFRVLWDSYENPDLLGPEQDSLDGSVITQGINPRLFEDLLVPHKDRWVRASEIEQEAVNPLSPSGVARLVGEARNSANNRAGMIYYYATFRRVFENLGATVDHVWNHKLGEHEQLPLEFVRPDGSKGAVVLYRPATTDAVQIRTRQASDRVFGKALGDLVTMVLDKPFELSAMGFDSITLPLYVVAGALRSQGYASEKDVQAFTQDFIYWVNSPVMLRYRKSVAARAKSALQPGAEETSAKQLARKEVEDSLQTAEDRLNWARFRALESIVYRASGLNHVLALLKNPVRSEDDALEAEAALREKDWRLGGSLHLPSVNSAQFRAASAKVNAVLRSEYPLRASIYRSPASVEALSRAALRRVPWLAGRDIFSKYSSATVATWLPRSFRDRVRRARIEPAALAEVLAARLGRSLQSAAEATVTALSEPGVRADAATTETAIRLRDSGTLDAGHIVRKDSPFVDHDWIRQLAVRVVGELREYIPHNAWVRNLDVNRRRGIISAPSAVMGLTGPTYAKIAADFDNLESFLPGGSYRMPVAYTEIDAAGKSTEVNLWLTLSADQIRDIVALYAVTRTYPEYSLLHLMSAGYNNALDRDVLAELQGGLWARTETPEFSAFVDYLDAQLDDDVLDRPYVPFVSVAPYLRAQPTALPVWALGERGPNAAELVASSGGVLAPREAEEATAEVDTRPLPVPPETRQAKVVGPVREPEPMDAPEMPVLLDSITAGAPISPSDSARPGSYRAIVPGFLSQAAQAAGTLELFLQNRAKSGFPTAVLVNADRTLSVGDRVLVGTQPAEVVEVRPYDNTQADEGRESALKEASGIDVGSLRLLADTAEGPRARAWLGLSASRKWQAVTVVLQTSVLADGALAYEAARKPGVSLKPVLQTQRGDREADLPSQKVVSASAQQQRIRLSAEVPALLPPGDAIALEQALADVPAGSDEAVIEILTKLLSDKDVASAIQALASVGADPRAVAAGNLLAVFKGEAPKDAGLIAVTTAIKTLLPHPEGMLGQVFGFDDIKVSQEQAERRLKKQGVRNPSQAEIDTLAQAIRDDWALTAKAGDDFHRVVQAVLAHKEAPAGASQDLLQLLSDYKTSKNTALLEQAVWGLGFSGRVDRIDVLADGSLVLYDYKTTNTDSDPHGSGTKFSRSYISGQDNSKYQSAKLQLYIYRRILETKGFRVKGAFVVPSVRTADGSVQLWKNTQGDYLLEANPDDMTLAYARRISEVSAHKGLAESQPQGAGANQASSASLESAEAGAARGYSGSFLFNTVGGSEPDRLQREIVKRFNEEHAAHVAANQIVNLIGRRQGAIKGQIFNEAGRKVGTLTPEQQDAAKVFGAVELALWSAEIYQTDSSGRRVRAVGQSLLDVILKPNFTKAKAEEWAKTHNLVIEDLVVPLGRPVTVGKTTLPANPTIAQALAAVEATGYADAIQSKGGYALSIWNDLNTLGVAARKLGLDSRHLLSKQQGLGVATQDLESAVDAVKKAGQKFPWWRVAAGDTLFAGVAEGALVTEFGGEHRDRVVDRAVLAAQLDILKSITGQDLAVSDTAKLGLTFTDVNRMIASGLEQRLVRAVHADRDYVNTEAGKLDLRTRAVLRRVLAYYDARGIAENIPWIPGVTGSLAELAASGTWAPAFSSAISQFKHAVMRRAAQAKSDALLYEFTQTLTPSGDPAIIVLPLAEAVHPANQDNPHPGAATTELMDMQALNLVKVLTRQHKPAVYDLAAPAAERARQFAVLVSTYTSGSQSYKSVRTHALRGVAAVWARDEVSWQVAHWLQDRMRWAFGAVDYLRVLRGLAAWMKSAVVTGSAFFFVSGFEGVVAATHLLDSLRTSELKGGGTPRQLLKDRAKGFFKMPSHLLKADEDVRDLFEDAAASGIMMEGDNAFDENISVVDRGLDTLRDWVRRNYGKKQADRADFFMRRIVRMQGITDRYFGRAGERVGVFQNFKFYILMHTAEHVAAQGYGVNFNALDREGRRKIFREIAPFINNAAGGQNWAQYWWATPNTRALLNLLFFAPNWTVSAWNVAGGGLLTGKIMGNDMDETERALVLANTMMMASVVLVGAPAALQAAIYAAGGDPDEGDVPLPWMNEPGRKLHIDITPLIRKMPGYTGGATGRRRVFMQFGKQALEVYDGWMTDVLKNATAKLSMPVKLVLEQALGRSPGSDWNLEFNGLGAAGWAYGLDEKGRRSFLRGRLGYIAQKALPMSVTSALLRPETLATTWIAPTSLGTSERKAVDACEAVLNSLAERDSWNELRSHPVVRGNAVKYVSNILHAADRNGYDGKRILQSAKSTVLTRLYRNFWGALDAGDFTDMEDYARAILRVGGTVKGATDSINRRRGLKDEPLSDVDKAAIDAAFAVAEPVKRQ